MEVLMAENTIADDTLEGAGAIADHTGKSVRQANYLLEKGLLPAFKIGNKWHMRKSTYRHFVEGLEATATKVA